MLASHGTPMRRLIESGAVEGRNFVQVGLRGYWPPPETFDWMQEQGLRWHLMREIEERGAEAVIADAIAEALDGPDAIYLSIDIDVIDPGMAPGTGTPEPGGMLTREVLRAVRQIVGAVELAGMDIVEVSPPYDQAETTAMAANRAALEAISALAVRRRDGHPSAGRADPSTRATRARTAPRPRRSRACTTSTWPTIRATSTSTSRSPSGPVDRSWSSPPGPAAWPSRWPRPATGSPASTSTRRCSTGHAPGAAAAGRGATTALDLVEADLRRTPAARRRDVRPRLHRPELAARAADRAAQRRALRTMADHLAPGGLAVVDVWLPDADDLAGSTVGSSSNGRGSTRRPARS